MMRRNAWVIGLMLSLSLGGCVSTGSAPPPGVVVIAQQGNPVATLRAALLDFESAVLWEASSPRWRDERGPWIAMVRQAGSPQELGQLALRLETLMTWESMEPVWRQERPGWVAGCNAAGSTGDIARLLLQLEARTLWGAMAGRWRGQRGPWVGAVQSVR